MLGCVATGQEHREDNATLPVHVREIFSRVAVSILGLCTLPDIYKVWEEDTNKVTLGQGGK